MSYSTDLQNNNTNLRNILNTVNNLPEATGGSYQFDTVQRLEDVVLLPETTNNFTETPNCFVSYFEIVEGETYTVVWDNTEYECVCVSVEIDSGAFMYILGNGSMLGLEDTGEPFVVVSATYDGRMSGIMSTLDEDTHTFTVYQKDAEITKLDNKHLDLDWLPVGGTGTLLGETTITGTNDFIYGFGTKNVEVGQTIVVVVDGVPYSTIVQGDVVDLDSFVYAGNPSLMSEDEDVPNTGEPFLLWILANSSTLAFALGNKVEVYSEDYRPLNPLPDRFISDDSRALIEVADLPTIDIKKNQFYHLKSAKFKFVDTIDPEGYICHYVDTLPIVGEVVTVDLSTLTAYYCAQNNQCYGYVNQELSDMVSSQFGADFEVGWHPIENLLPIAQIEWGGIFTINDEVPSEVKLYLIVNSGIYQYGHEWDRLLTAFDLGVITNAVIASLPVYEGEVEEV